MPPRLYAEVIELAGFGNPEVRILRAAGKSLAEDLADPKLAKLERSVNDLESEREILMYLRHEAGHAFNYAYRLYATPEWRELFGPFNRRYRDHYRPVPFSRKFVRHMEGWYAQKHPDEDFAETFAVWLTPRSGWRKRYAG